MGMIKAVIFDVGGVLHTDESDNIRRSITSHLKISEEQYRRACKMFVPLLGTGKITENKFWELFIKETGSKIRYLGKSLWLPEYEKRFHKCEDVFEIIEKLKEKGIKIAVLSNTNKTHGDFNKKKGLYDLFDVVILSYEVGVRKPGSKIYEITLEKLGVKPEEAVFVDDYEENVLAAEKFGMKGIIFKSAGLLKKDLWALMESDHPLPTYQIGVLPMN